VNFVFFPHQSIHFFVPPFCSPVSASLAGILEPASVRQIQRVWVLERVMQLNVAGHIGGAHTLLADVARVQVLRLEKGVPFVDSCVEEGKIFF
jgi:hypothetical protein